MNVIISQCTARFEPDGDALTFLYGDGGQVSAPSPLRTVVTGGYVGTTRSWELRDVGRTGGSSYSPEEERTPSLPSRDNSALPHPPSPHLFSIITDPFSPLPTLLPSNQATITSSHHIPPAFLPSLTYYHLVDTSTNPFIHIYIYIYIVGLLK